MLALTQNRQTIIRRHSYQIPRIGFAIKITCILILSIIITNKSFAWLTLSPGLKYKQYALSGFNPFAKLNVFQISLKQYALNVAINHKPPLNLKRFSLQHNALIVINGGFFTPEHDPLGLRAQLGEQLNAIKPISWWSIFSITNKHPLITPPNQFALSNKTEMAIQAGPRLVINNQIPKLKAGLAERTALGIVDANTIIIAVTDNAAIHTADLAYILQHEFHCKHALNLDGGSSTQLYAKIGNFQLQNIGNNRISDVIYVTKRA